MLPFSVLNQVLVITSVDMESEQEQSFCRQVSHPTCSVWEFFIDENERVLAQISLKMRICEVVCVGDLLPASCRSKLLFCKFSEILRFDLVAIAAAQGIERLPVRSADGAVWQNVYSYELVSSGGHIGFVRHNVPG